ncbi:hypothetical protein RWE15_03290 [Virgibacillus halophilus]|uniref:PTS EIIB type-3 domain-containing protein n=1 Tax=Tigheibacillus halophilus TaxID=361280 RepID=A0ABU5C2V5_9BACI|nr:hypothetical protein [Virgibacillus halophilus]
MVQVILSCSSGMSSSLLAKRTQEAAVETSQIITITAMDIALVERHLDEADLVLLGPHLKYKLEELQLKCQQTQMDLVSKEIYQSFNGRELLKQIQGYQFIGMKGNESVEENKEKSEDEKKWTSQLPFKSFFTPETLEVMRWKR